jgi:hypothetical protein
MTISPLSDKLPTATPYSQDTEGNLELELLELNPLVDVLSEVLGHQDTPQGQELSEVLQRKLSETADPAMYSYMVLEHLAATFLEYRLDGRHGLTQAAYVCAQLAANYPQ